MEKTIETDRRKRLLDGLKLVGIGRSEEFQTIEAYSNLVLTDVKYSTYK
jgi:hypothetical protein